MLLGCHTMWKMLALVAKSLEATSISAAKRKVAEELVRDPSNNHANNLMTVLASLPPGEVITVGTERVSRVLIPGPRKQSTTDPGTAQTWKLAKAYAPSTAPVLILGESGTGKEAIARVLHEESPRANEPFIAINCGGFTETLVESELFGYEKGAFTGAATQKKGSLEAAKEGTVFLDEIGELPLQVQVRLLRVLEDRTFRRVGGDGANPVAFKGRIIAATHRDLMAQTRASTFREDLFYRLAVLVLRTVPLRERIEDAVELAKLWLGEEGLLLSEAAADRIRAYTFPGNIRELNNIIRRAVVHAKFENRTLVIVPDLGFDTWAAR